MAFRRVLMQPAIRISAPAAQEVRFAAQTTGWKTAVFWVNVFQNAFGSNTALDIRAASLLGVNDDVSTSGGFWPRSGTISLPASATGAFKTTLTELPDFVRWQIASLGAAMCFEVILYLWDR